MAELLCSKYIPREVIVTRCDSDSAKVYLSLKYEFKELANGYYQFEKPAVLEMVFREGEKDFVFSDMLNARSQYIDRWRKAEGRLYYISEEKFVEFIVKGIIRVTILPDGSYTVN